MRSIQADSAAVLRRLVIGETGQPGRVALSCGLTGAVIAGGVFVAALALLGQVSSSALLPLTGIFLVAGGLVGFFHGAALGLIGRGSDVRARDAFKSIGFAALLSIPCLVFAALTAVWISFTAVAWQLGADAIWLFVLAGWVAGGGIAAWCTWEVFSAAANALEHWPDRRLGTPLVAATFVVLQISFWVTRPEIWWTDVEVTGLGAVILAVGATLWIGLPIEVLTLRLFHRSHAQSA